MQYLTHMHTHTTHTHTTHTTHHTPPTFRVFLCEEGPSSISCTLLDNTLSGSGLASLSMRLLASGYCRTSSVFRMSDLRSRNTKSWLSFFLRLERRRIWFVLTSLRPTLLLLVTSVSSGYGRGQSLKKYPHNLSKSFFLTIIWLKNVRMIKTIDSEPTQLKSESSSMIAL